MAGRKNKVTGSTILDKLWTELDTATEAVMVSVSDPWRAADEKAQGMARGLATAIHIASHPVYHDVDTVVGIAVQRRGTQAAFSGAPSIIHHAPPNGILDSETVTTTDEESGNVVEVPAPPAPGEPVDERHVVAIQRTVATGVDHKAAAALLGLDVATVDAVVAQYGTGAR